MDVVKIALAKVVWCLLRPLLFLMSAENAHDFTMGVFARLMKFRILRRFTAALFAVNDPRLHVRKFGIDFANPVGLAAGMDKNAAWHDDLLALGFGFVEVGTITARSQLGNQKPRIERLPQDNALLNRMGSPNKGAEDAAARLNASPPQAILGINIGKTTATPIEDAKDDYLFSFERLYPFAAYFVLNVSSPNTPGLRKLQASEYLKPILRTLMDRNAVLSTERKERPKPLLVKIAPDLEEHQLNEIVDLCVELQLDGIIVANTTTSRDGLKTPMEVIRQKGEGGISGLPLTQRSRALVAAVYRRTQGNLPIIGVGGITSPEHAWEMIRAGASLIQVYSGLVYGGPGFVAAINRHLARALSERRIASIADVIGESADQEQGPKSSDAPQVASSI